MAASDKLIDPAQIYFLTYRGKSELTAAGTSLSPAELELLVLIDGKATVSQVQTSAENLAPAEVIEVMDRLLRSEYIALQLIDLGDVFGASAPRVSNAEMPDESAIERGVSSLRQNGYIVRIARRPTPEHRHALMDKHAVMTALDRKLTLLVVEDDPNLAENVRMVLTQTGFAARVATNREQVIEALRRSPLVDLVLLDVTLPDADGFAILGDMRHHPVLAEVPVIMVTGAATREAVLKGLLARADGYITKPFEINVLIKAVNAVLGIEPGEHDTESNHLWERERR